MIPAETPSEARSGTMRPPASAPAGKGAQWTCRQEADSIRRILSSSQCGAPRFRRCGSKIIVKSSAGPDDMLLNARFALLLCVAAALAGILVHLSLFSFRYGWYADASNSTLLLVVYGGFLAASTCLWIFFPSRILVALLALVTFALPPMLRPRDFVALDVPFSVFVGMALLIIVGAVELRRRSVVNRPVRSEGPSL